jgi:hypothetical protein
MKIWHAVLDWEGNADCPQICSFLTKEEAIQQIRDWWHECQQELDEEDRQDECPVDDMETGFIDFVEQWAFLTTSELKD